MQHGIPYIPLRVPQMALGRQWRDVQTLLCWEVRTLWMADTYTRLSLYLMTLYSCNHWNPSQEQKRLIKKNIIHCRHVSCFCSKPLICQCFSPVAYSFDGISQHPDEHQNSMAVVKQRPLVILMEPREEEPSRALEATELNSHTVYFSTTKY